MYEIEIRDSQLLLRSVEEMFAILWHLAEIHVRDVVWWSRYICKHYDAQVKGRKTQIR
jgi:hypothetical protein